jgi:RimJ/RimL family protein N-acetyltransferase
MAAALKCHLPIVLGDLTLRRVHRDDAADLLEYRSDPLVARQQFWDPFNSLQVASLIADQSCVVPGMYGVPLILALEFDGKVIGDFSLTINSPEHSQGEVGFSFHQKFTHRGLATRALSGVLGFGFLQLRLHRITAATFTDNERAGRLMERVGMRREAHFVHDAFVRGRWVDVYVFGMLADEWQTQHAELLAYVTSDSP